MDKSVEVGDDIGVKVVDHIYGVARSDALILLYFRNNRLA